MTFTFTVTNSSSVGENDGGPTGLGTTGAVVTDVLPPGIQFVSAPSNCTFAAATDTLTCDLGPVAESQIVTASFVGRVVDVARYDDPRQRDPEHGQRRLGGRSGGFSALPDLDPSDNNNAASVTVNPQTDLSLTKTASTQTPDVDDEVDYTLTAHNGGPNDATGVTIQDSLPAGLDFLDATPGCNNEAGTVTCDIGAIANGDSASVTIKTRTTAAIAGTAIGNLASVTGNEFDPDTTNNQASTTVDVQPLVDLDLDKVASNPTPSAGGTVTYTLSLVNHGPSPATGVTVTDPLPSGLSFISSTASQGSCGASGQTVTCQLGTLGAGATAVVTVDTRVASSDAGATVQNTATASADEPIARPQLLESSASIKPQQAPPPSPGPGPSPASADLAVVKTVNHTTARVDEPLTYTITVTNHGPDAAATPTVTDTPSPDLKLVSVHATGGSCTHGAPISCKLSSIPSGGHELITVVARPSKSGQLRNSATAVSPTTDPNMTNNESRVTTDVHPGHAALRLSKTPSTHTVQPGQTFSFTIAVRSLGPAPATGVKVCDVLGSGMTFVSVHGATFSHGSPCWKISSLAKGEQRRFKVDVRAPMVSGPRTLTNTATASASGVHQRKVRARVKLAGASSASTPTPHAAPPRDAKLTITKTVDQKRARFGSTLRYTITVTNAGPATAKTPSVTDTFSTAASIVSVHPSSGSCPGRNPLTCKLASIGSGAHATIIVTARPHVLGTIRNSASGHHFDFARARIAHDGQGHDRRHHRRPQPDRADRPHQHPEDPARRHGDVATEGHKPQPMAVAQRQGLRPAASGDDVRLGEPGRETQRSGRVLDPRDDSHRMHRSRSRCAPRPCSASPASCATRRVAEATGGGHHLSAHAHADVLVAPTGRCGSRSLAAPSHPQRSSRRSGLLSSGRSPASSAPPQ